MAGGELFETGAIEIASECGAAFVRPGEIGAGEGVIGAVVFPEAEVEFAVGREGEAGDAVVGVFVFGDHINDERATGFGFSLVRGVVEAVDLGAGGDVEVSGVVENEVSGEGEVVVKESLFVGLAVAGGVFEDEDAIGGVAGVIVGAMVGVVFGDEDAAGGVDGDAGGGDDIGVFGEERDFDIGICGGEGGLGCCGNERDPAEGDEEGEGGAVAGDIHGSKGERRRGEAPFSVRGDIIRSDLAREVGARASLLVDLAGAS